VFFFLVDRVGVYGGNAPPPVQDVVEGSHVDLLASHLRGLSELVLEASEDLRCEVG
jgi:hypothetical protein